MAFTGDPEVDFYKDNPIEGVEFGSTSINPKEREFLAVWHKRATTVEDRTFYTVFQESEHFTEIVD